MGPSFGERVADEDAADDRRHPVRMLELEKVPRPHLVNGREQQVGRAGDVRRLLRLLPLRIGRGDVVDRRQVLLERARRIDVGEVAPLIRRRFVHERPLGPGNGDEVVRAHERFERLHLLGPARDDAAGRLVGCLAGDALCHCRAGGERAARLAQRRDVARHVVATELLEPIDRHVNPLGRAKHLRKLVGAKRERLRLRLALRFEPGVDIRERFRRAALVVLNSACRAASFASANAAGISLVRYDARPPKRRRPISISGRLRGGWRFAWIWATAPGTAFAQYSRGP